MNQIDKIKSLLTELDNYMVESLTEYYVNDNPTLSKILASRASQTRNEIDKLIDETSSKLECLQHQNHEQAVHILSLTDANTARLIPQSNIDELTT